MKEDQYIFQKLFVNTENGHLNTQRGVKNCNPFMYLVYKHLHHLPFLIQPVV